MLTTNQLAALKAAILANAPAAALLTDGNLQGLADLMNAPAAPAFSVWRTSVSTDEIFDSINWANFTPSPVPDGTAAWTNRALACQGKQFNLQTMLTGRATLNPSKPRIRDGLQDALTDVPSGANGNARQAGWTQVLAKLYRPATAFERIFATGTGTDLAPGSLGAGVGGEVIEGEVGYIVFVGL